MKRAFFFISVFALGLLLSACDSSSNQFASPDLQGSDVTTVKEGNLIASTGSVVFWTRPDQQFEEILVTVARVDSRYTTNNSITSPWLDSNAPDCGAHAGCAYFTLPVGDYSYSARRESGDEINAFIKVTADGCERIYIPRKRKPLRETAGN